MSDLTGRWAQSPSETKLECYRFPGSSFRMARGSITNRSQSQAMVSPNSRILIAEDQAVVAMEIEDRLKRLGYDVVGIAATAERAIALARSLEPDLLLFDIRLEGHGDGVEAAEAILADRAVPVVFLSAYADEQTMGRVRHVEPAAYLLKPFDEQMLQITLDTALYKHRVAQERQREERERRAVEARLATVLDHSPDAIISMGEERRVEVFNRGAERTFGYDFRDACGMRFEELIEDRGNGGAEALFDELELLVGLEESPVVRGEVLGRRRDGTSFPAEISLAHFEREGEAGGHITAIVRDVTERNRMQEKFVRAQKLEAIGRLAAGVAHDFNNLLSAIQCNAFLAGRAAEKPEELRAAVRAINGSVRRGSSLTRQLLGFAKRQPVAPRVLDLGEAIAAIEQLLCVLAGAENEIAIDVLPGAGAVEIDPSRLEQALMNLVVNARDAMPGGGRLRFSVDGHESATGWRARTGPLAPGSYVRLSVADDGVGMEPDVLDRIFEPFFTTKGARRGTGLGLSTVMDVAVERGGGVDVESTPGEGTTFFLYFPRVDSPPEALDVGRTTPPPVTLEVSVLLVDDDEILCGAIERVLSGAGCRVRSVSSGEEALRLCGSGERFDLALVDLVMPGLSGRSAAESLRELDPDMPILHMSGHPGIDERVVHGSPILQKPFSIGELMSSLTQLALPEPER